jgi:FkbM family methyltransferase
MRNRTLVKKRWFKKWLFGRCPGLAGSFRYLGVKVFFPPGSRSFAAACDQGIFEVENVRVLQSMTKPDTTVFDVGANIGLMAIPLLAQVPGCRVISFEPSENTVPYLRKTIEGSPYKQRWSLVAKAVGRDSGRVSFSLSSKKNSLFDGLKSTGRVPEASAIEVEMTTLDEIWRNAGRPKISVIKVDVEGAELQVLEGAAECLRQEKPSLLLEWNGKNLKAYDCPPNSLCDFAVRNGYGLYSIPNGTKVDGPQELALQMVFTESFLLMPALAL